MKSGDQAKEFYDGLSEDVQNCFKAYGAETYVDMLEPARHRDRGIRCIPIQTT